MNKTRTVILMMLMAGPAVAQVEPTPSMSGQPQRQAACILENSRDTTSRDARRLIAKACNFLSMSTANMALHAKEKAYNECLLENLAGMERGGDATDVANACRTLTMP